MDVTHGANFSAMETGRLADLDQHSFLHPALRRPAPGKLFLKDLLGLGGVEVSLNKLPAGATMPFTHRHQANAELYLFIGGDGEMWIDGTVLPVHEGSVLRIDPAANRAWRNTGATPLYYVVLQYPADAEIGSTIADGVIVDRPVPWPPA